MSEIRWTDKVYLDNQGNIRSSDGCPTDEPRPSEPRPIRTEKSDMKVYYNGKEIKGLFDSPKYGTYNVSTGIVTYRGNNNKE